MRLIARQGHPLPGSSSSNPLWLIDPRDSDDRRYGYSLSNAGVLLQAMHGTGDYGVGAWYLPTAGNPVPIAFSGQTIPDGDLIFDWITADQLSDSGRALLSASLHASATDANVAAYSHWAFSPSEGLQPVARSGLAAPGTPPPTVFDSLYFHRTMNERGDVIVVGTVAPSVDRMTVTSSSSGDPQGIWAGRTIDDLQLIARSWPDDPRFGHFTSPAINEQGDVAFVSGFKVWLFRNGSISSIVESGQMAPGMTPPQPFHNFGPAIVSDSGKVVFGATTVGDEAAHGGFGIWEYANGELRPIAARSIAAPMLDGRLFSAAEIESLVMNDAGQIVFDAQLSGGHRGLFAQDVEGNLHTIALRGDALEVADGDSREIDFAHTAGINNRGEVVFYASFTDGSQGIFVSDAVAIPEPKSVVLLVVALAYGFIARTCSRRCQ
jgi:hypothetical protein